MKAVRGVLITCDAAVKQIILSLDEQNRFVIEDLDETHVLVSADSVATVRAQVEAELEKNTYNQEL